MTIGESIKTCREKRGFSQGKLSRISGISQALISKWELDKSVPMTFSLLCIADALDVSLDELVGRERRHKQ